MVKDYNVGDVIRGDHRVITVRKGELSRVYICRQELPGGNFAYKALKTFRFSSDEIGRKLFERELVYWARLPPHTNIVQAKDADTVERLLVLEHVRGPTLRQVASKRPVHPRHFLKWARELADGLSFLHKESFLHRDLRPTNVMIDAENDLRVKITDLGIGKPFDPQAASHNIIGTFTYMAPEVHLGKTDFRSDIFSFGATLYYLLTGNFAVKLTTANLESVVSPRSLVPTVPEEVAAFVLKCVQREPEARYQSMDEVQNELSALAEWDADAALYNECAEHNFTYYAGGTNPVCPFCLYEASFREQLQKLEQKLSD